MLRERTLPATGEPVAGLESFDRLMMSFLAEHGVPGASLAVTKRGRLVYARGFGYACRRRREPAQPTSLLRIASISKPITAVAVLQFVERGDLKLADRVFDLLQPRPHLEKGGALDPRLGKVTVGHLLHHTGGWDRDLSFDPMFRSVEIARALGVRPPAKPSHIIRYMMGQPLQFEPGERYAYSNFGYSLLGRVVEALSGQSYRAYVRQHVLAPIGIRAMRLGKSLLHQRAPNEVRYYTPRNERRPAVLGERIGRRVPAPYGAFCVEGFDAHGGWIASAPDLARFAAQFDRPAHCRLLGSATIRLMFARPKGLAGRHRDGRPRATFYGCGWRIRRKGRRANQWHAGMIAGTSTLLVRRHDGLNWAVLFNSHGSPKREEPLASLIDPLLHRAANAVRTWAESEPSLPSR